jgi:hypothetical protein
MKILQGFLKLAVLVVAAVATVFTLLHIFIFVMLLIGVHAFVQDVQRHFKLDSIMISPVLTALGMLVWPVAARYLWPARWKLKQQIAMGTILAMSLLRAGLEAHYGKVACYRAGQAGWEHQSFPTSCANEGGWSLETEAVRDYFTGSYSPAIDTGDGVQYLSAHWEGFHQVLRPSQFFTPSGLVVIWADPSVCGAYFSGPGVSPYTGVQLVPALPIYQRCLLSLPSAPAEVKAVVTTAAATER